MHYLHDEIRWERKTNKLLRWISLRFLHPMNSRSCHLYIIYSVHHVYQKITAHITPVTFGTILYNHIKSSLESGNLIFVLHITLFLKTRINVTVSDYLQSFM